MSPAKKTKAKDIPHAHGRKGEQPTPATNATARHPDLVQLDEIIKRIKESELTESEKEAVRLRLRSKNLELLGGMHSIPDEDRKYQLEPNQVVFIQQWSEEPSPAAASTPLFKDSDPDIALRIKQDSLCLLIDPRAQDAVARWMYAARKSKNPKTREKASELLNEFTKPIKGRRRKTPELEPKRFLQSREELRSFIEIQLRSVPEKASDSMVRNRFPVFAMLEREYDLDLKVLKHPIVAGPTPSDIAAHVIGKVFGIDPDTVWKLGTIAKKPPSEKTSKQTSK